MLLTSPPLTASNLKESIKSVRLACLMCAASVNPEPGSNSQFCCIYITSFEILHIFVRVAHIFTYMLLLFFILVFSKFSWFSTNVG